MLEPTPIRRILLALDPSAASHASLQTAARLAAGMAAELRGVFVEDDELSRLAQLPIAAEVRQGTLEAEALSLDRLARELAVLAARMERDLAGLATQMKFNWSFSVLHGPAGERLVELGEQVDLVLCAGAAGARYRTRGLGQPARQLARGARRPVLLTGRAGVHGPVCALCEPQRDAQAVIAAAHSFQRLLGGPLVTVGMPPAGALLPAHTLRRPVAGMAADVVAAAARDCGLLVLDSDGQAGAEAWLHDLTDRFAGSVLLVR